MEETRETSKKNESFANLKQELSTIREALNFQTHDLGEDYFNTVVKFVSQLLCCRITFVGKLVDDNFIQTVAHFRDGSICNNFKYNLDDSPCKTVVGREVCIYPENVAKIFYKDIGLVELCVEGYAGIPLFSSKQKPIGIFVAIFKNPINNPELVKSVLQIFSSQIGAELEHNKIYADIKETQKKLRKSYKEKSAQKQRIDEILEGTNAGTWEWIIKSGEIELNQRWAEIIGYDLSELKQDVKTWIDSVHPVDYQKAASKLEAHFNGESDYYEAEFRQKHKNGEWVWVIARGKVTQWDDNHNPIKMSGTHLDITDRKKAEEILMESENQLQLIFDSSPAVMILVNENREVLRINNFGLQYIGKTYDQIEAKKLGDVLSCINSAEDKRGCGFSSACMDCVVRNLILKSVFSNESTTREITKISIDRNGQAEERMIQVSISTASEEPAKTILITIDDITELKRVEKALMESEHRYHSIIESASDAIILADSKDGKILDVNKKAEEMLGKEKSQIIGIHQTEIYAPEDREAAARIFQIDKLNGRKPVLHEIYVQHSSGSKIPVELNPARIGNEEGEDLMVGFYRNISERLEAKKELSESYQKYKTLADYTFDWEYWKDTKNSFIYVSPSCKKITGYEPEDFMDDPKLFRSLIYHEDLECWDNHERNSLNRIPCTKPIEFRIVGKDGQLIWIDHACQPVYDEAGNFLGNRGTNREITVRKQTEGQLIKSEEKYRLLFENMTSGFALHEMIYDKNGEPIDYRFLEINPAFELLTGLKAEKILGSTVKTIMPKTESYWIEAAHEVCKTERSKEIEHYSQELNKYYKSYLFSPKKGQFATVINDVTEKRKSEQELAASERKLQLYLEQTPLGVIEWGPNTEILSWNDAAQQIFGYTYSEVKNKEGISLLVPADQRREMQKVWKKIQKEGFLNNLSKVITKKGNEIICEWSHTTIKDADQITIGVISMVQDVTERERIQSELRTSEERHKMISKVSSDYVYFVRVNPDSKLLLDWTSGAFQRITGYTAEEINKLEEAWVSIIYKDDWAKLKDSFADSKFSIARNHEYRIVTKSGLIKWISDNYIPFCDADGVNTGIVGSVTDITDRKKTEISLRQSEERLKHFAEVTHEGILIHDEGIVLELNKAVEKITGYSEVELIGKDIRELVHEKYLPFLEENLKERTYTDNIIRSKRKNGDEIFIQTTVRPYFFMGKKVRLTSIFDVTEKIETEETLRKNEEYLKQAQRIAHLGYWYWDVTSDELIYSDEIKNIYELKADDLSLETIYKKHIFQDDKESIDLVWDQMIEKGTKFDKEFRIHTSERVKWLRVVAELLRNEQGEPVSVSGITYDITNRKEAEVQLRKHELEKLELNSEIANYKMMALRSAMNPHFIFNCLNSIQYFIMGNDKKSAISYLSLFSNLIRNVLNSAVDQYSTLEKEIETLKYYVELENLRFENQFWFNLVIDDSLDISEIEIPSLIIQPYVENAIIHGLMNKEEAGILKLEIGQNDNKLLCIVEDDGVGREKAQRMNSEKKYSKKSVGMSVTQERLDIVNRTNDVSVKIIDLKKHGNPAGTRVEILITV